MIKNKDQRGFLVDIINGKVINRSAMGRGIEEVSRQIEDSYGLDFQNGNCLEFAFAFKEVIPGCKIAILSAEEMPQYPLHVFLLWNKLYAIDSRGLFTLEDYKKASLKFTTSPIFIFPSQETVNNKLFESLNYDPKNFLKTKNYLHLFQKEILFNGI